MNASADIRRRMRLRLAVAAGVLAAVALLCSSCTGSATAGSTAPTSPAGTTAPAQPGQVSAILVQPVSDAQVVPGSDGMDHVEYNLMVVNAFSAPVTLTSVAVIAPDGKELARISGAQLGAATQSLYAHAPSPVIAASAAVAIEVDVALRPERVPDQVTNRIDYTIPAGLPDAAIIDSRTVSGPQVSVDRGKAMVIAPPLAGDGWLATSACCSPNVHRDLRLAADGLHLATSETFAVDWAQAKGDRLYSGDGSTNEEFYGFGAKVLAVADGTVVAAHDGVPESTPFSSSVAETKEGFGGNQLIVKIAPGVYAAYAHLQPGSLTVRVGDTVKVGQVLARLGNSGPSQGPHLHFGLLDAPDLFVGRSLPFAVASFTLTGTVNFAASPGDELAITPVSRREQKAYPLYGTIADFP